MKLIASVALLTTITASAASVDMNNPRRVVGREDDVRIDAQILQETVTPGSAIAVTYQIQNLTAQPVAVAAKVCDASYDADTRTITLAVGSEVPADGHMPLVTMIAPGEKKTFSASATPRLHVIGGGSPFSNAPRYVQVKVTILRNIEPFAQLIAQQPTRAPQTLSDELFDRWLESKDSIFLNAVPVRYQARARAMTDVESRTPGRMF
jgi:hypothetical protein